MNEPFEQRVHAAAGATWRLSLVVLAFLLLQYVLYLWFIGTRPDWLLRLWGPEIGWSEVQWVWFWALVWMKVFFWLLALVALWLTFWARQLRQTNKG